MTNLETAIRQAFKSDPRIHVIVMGVCTVTGTSGNFAAFKNQRGDFLYHVEAPDAIDAAMKICAMVTQRPTEVQSTPTPPMQTRVVAPW